MDAEETTVKPEDGSAREVPPGEARLEQTRKQMRLIRELLRKNDNNNEAVAELRSLLARHPEIWRELGDLGAYAATRLAAFGKPKDRAGQLSLLKGMDEVRQGLGWEDASFLERLLIDQMTLAWMAWQVTVLSHAMLGFQGLAESRQGDYWERRLAEVERRFHRAAETLAKIQRLLQSRPGLQVNIAQQQIVANLSDAGKGRTAPDGFEAWRKSQWIDRKQARKQKQTTGIPAGETPPDLSKKGPEVPEEDPSLHEQRTAKDGISGGRPFARTWREAWN